MPPKKRSPTSNNTQHPSPIQHFASSTQPDSTPSTFHSHQQSHRIESPSGSTSTQSLPREGINPHYPLATTSRRSSEGSISDSNSPRNSVTPNMRNSSQQAMDTAPTSTPTGRISKAKKGKRVHACSYDGCGKIFTRAEHRRRHELNHNSEAMFSCTRPGCRKAFHRLDLLQRHQERHDLENQLEAQSHRHRHINHLSVASEVHSTMPPTTMSNPAVSQVAPRSSSGGMSIGSLVHPQSEYHYGNLGTSAFNSFGRHAIPYSGFTSSDDTIFYTPESSQSPVSELYGRNPHRQSVSSSSSVAAFDPSGTSPMMRTASTWVPSSAPPSILSGNMFDDSFMPVGGLSYYDCSFTEADQSITDTSVPIPLSDLDGYEWSVIRGELSSAPGILPSNDGNGISDTIRWYCLEYYWQYFHPFFPVVHRPTFLPTKPSPLLASAMMAIGSHFDQRADSRLYSLTLLEIATKLLRRRDNITSRSRLVDLQSVFLLEVLSKYCSRRVEVEMSSRFRSLYASLDQARRSLSTNPLAVFRTLSSNPSPDDLSKAHKFWVEHETRRRILQSCAILDMQQTTYFEQPATIKQHGRTRLSTEIARSNISLPCSDELWETSPIEKWAESAKTYEYSNPDKVTSTALSQGEYLDYFQMQAWLSADSRVLSQMLLNEPCYELRLMAVGSGKNCMKFNKRAMALAKHSPVRSLLIVSGESWIFGKKLEKELDFQTAKQTLRTWIDAGTDSLPALWHATALLRSQIIFKPDLTGQGITASFGDFHMLHQGWSFYLAALICWAHSVQPSITGSGDSRTSFAALSQGSGFYRSMSGSASVYPNQMNGDEATRQAQQYLKRTEVNNPRDLVNVDPIFLGQVHGLLEVVRQQMMAPDMGGLMCEAERVLFRLVEGRNTMSHF